eukprot:2953778-Pleurochrysis_carterae.AAC.1
MAEIGSQEASTADRIGTRSSSKNKRPDASGPPLPASKRKVQLHHQGATLHEKSTASVAHAQLPCNPPVTAVSNTTEPSHQQEAGGTMLTDNE